MIIPPFRSPFLLATVASLLAPMSASLHAATPSIVVSGLTAPTKTTTTLQGNLLAAEAGTGPNTGRLSLVTLADGSRKTLIEGLPSGLASPNNQPSGPSGLARQGSTVYLMIGTGDAVIDGAVPQTTVPNPAPSSPLFTSVLSIQFALPPEQIASKVTLSGADHAALKSGTRIVRDSITIELVVNFPDFVAEPLPAAPNAVRASNPFGLTVLGDRLFVVDASLNSIRTIDLASRATATLTTFAPLPNTRGMGPPVVEAVPDSIRVYGDQLLVTFLTGFPFPLGAAQVRLVDPNTGANAPFIAGLTSAIDVLPLPGGGFLTLEHTRDMLLGAAAGPSGRMQWYAASNAAPVVIHNAFSSPTRLELDERTGAVFVTEIFAGRIVKLSPWSLGPVAAAPAGSFSSVSVRGNAGAGNDTLIAGFVVEATAKQVLVRGVGPRLANFGVGGVLADPRIVLFDSAGRAIAENDNWSAAGDAETALLTAAAARTGAFPLPAGSRDAALIRTLPPGAYTVHVSSVGAAAGIALAEVYHVP